MVGIDVGAADTAVNDLNNVMVYNLSSNLNYNSVYANLFTELDINCQYYSEKSVYETLNNLNSGYLSCFSLNIQSFPSKYNELRNLMSNLNNNKSKIDIFCFNETWCNDFSRYNFPGYSTFFSARTNGNRGGSAILIKNSIIANQITNNCLFIENIMETTVIKINYNGFKAIIVAIYRPNCHTTLDYNAQVRLFLEKAELLFQFLDSFDLPIIFQGDLNLDLFSINDINSNASQFLDLATSFGLIQCINRATRIADNSATLIDLCLLKNLLPNLLFSGVLAIDIADHFGTFVAIRTDKIKKRKDAPTKKRLINPTTKLSFFNCLSALDWNEVTNLECPDLAYQRFYGIFIKFYLINFPLTLCNQSNKDFIPKQPFMTQGMLRCRSKKEELARAAKASPTPNLIEIYKNYRNIYNKTIKTASKIYYRNKIARAQGDSKQVWSTLKECLNLPRKTNNVTKIIKDDDTTITDNKQIADAFNVHLSNIGPSLANSMPNSTKHFTDYLPPPAGASFFMEPISVQNMYNYILSTNPKNSLDDNDISMKLLHEVAAPLSIPLAHIFNQSIATGIFPTRMKVSRTIPIFKSGSPFSLDNFRGVAIINSFSKVFEKIFSDRLTQFYEDNNFFIDTQFGFRRRTSTVHALSTILNEITRKLNEDKYVLLIAADIRKCFDCVDRSILFKKLENSGVRGHALDWFKSYFNNRSQRVYVNGVNSSSRCDLPFGVLQGSILGVILFLVFINDIPFATQTLLSILFADDNNCILAESSLHDLLSLANFELNELLQWYNANKLCLHPSKTKCLIFRPPRTNLNLNQDQNGRSFLPIFLNMNNPNEHNITKIIQIKLVPNPEESSAKILGILIDEKLNFKEHFKFLHSKILKAVFSLRIMKHLLDKKHLTLLYIAYLKSNLEYGSALFTTASQSTIKPIIILQKKAIRLICQVGYREHTAELFKNEKLLRYEDIMTFNRCKLMFDYKHNNLPNIFTNTWRQNNQVHNYPLRNAMDYFIDNVSKPYLDKFPLFQFPRSWNSLPEEIKNIESRKLFCKELSSYLINEIVVE